MGSEGGSTGEGGAAGGAASSSSTGGGAEGSGVADADNGGLSHDGGDRTSGASMRWRVTAHDLALKGAPHALRMRVWSHVSRVGALMKCYPTHYADMLSVGRLLHEHDRNEIEIDLGRTFPNHPLFAGDAILSDPEPPGSEASGAAAATPSGCASGGASAATEASGRTALRNVLLAYVAHNRGLGYCQALNYVGGMLLLLTELQEELAFFLLIHLTERCVTDFYSKYMTGIRIQQKVCGGRPRPAAFACRPTTPSRTLPRRTAHTYASAPLTNPPLLSAHPRWLTRATPALRGVLHSDDAPAGSPPRRSRHAALDRHDLLVHVPVRRHAPVRDPPSRLGSAAHRWAHRPRPRWRRAA